SLDALAAPPLCSRRRRRAVLDFVPRHLARVGVEVESHRRPQRDRALTRRLPRSPPEAHGADRLRGILGPFEDLGPFVDALSQVVAYSAERLDLIGAVQNAIEHGEFVGRDQHRLAALPLLPHALPETAPKPRLLRLVGPCLTYYTVAGHGPRSVPRCLPADRHRRPHPVAANQVRGPGMDGEPHPPAPGQAPRGAKPY